MGMRTNSPPEVVMSGRPAALGGKPSPAQHIRSFDENALAEALPDGEDKWLRLRVCSLNVHGWHNSDGTSWEGLISTLRATQPDIILLQEATKHRLPALAQALGDLHWTSRHNCAILSRYALSAGAVNQVQSQSTKQRGSAWKGKTTATTEPKKELQRHGRHFERFCTATIAVPGALSLEIVCLHLDHVTETTRMGQLRDLVEHQLESGRNARQIWAGDFNALTVADYAEHELHRIADHRARNAWESPKNDVSAMMTSPLDTLSTTGRRKPQRAPALSRGLGFTDCWHAAVERSGPLGTSRFDSRIDYVYCSPALMEHGAVFVARCDHLQTVPHVSDHNAVLAELVIPTDTRAAGQHASV